jgi:DNA polymerase-4
LGAERTFSENISSEIYMLEKLEDIAEEVERRLQHSKVAGKTITLKLKYSDFSIQTRSKTLKLFIASKALIMEETKALLYQEPIKDSIRLLGISLSNLNTENQKTVKAASILKEEQLKLPF